MTEFLVTHFAFLSSAEGWAAMVTLVAMEVVLGIDNLILSRS
jgi:predicted tellurium resistance membrane protein TerC